MARGDADDEHGAAIEVCPRHEVMMPGTGENEMVRQDHLDDPPRDGCFHLAVGTKLSKDENMAIGRREGWRALCCSRGRFDVVTFWLENSLMIEFPDSAMHAQHKARLTGASKRQPSAPAA